MKTSWIWWLVGAVACVGIFVGVNAIRQAQDEAPVEVANIGTPDSEESVEKPKQPVEQPQSLADALGLDEEDMVEVGGVMRPKRDLLEDKHDLVAARARYLKSIPNPGKAPFVPKDTNPTVAKLHEELQKNPGAHPSKSMFSSAERFDREAYLKNPNAYLILTRPGRVFQSAKANADVDRIRARGSTYREILQGESVVLEAEAEPKMPVTFHTQQLGEFDNRLKTITVAADDDGVAKVNYKAVTGVMGMVYVMAASPTSSGQLRFKVDVSLSE